MNKHVNIIIIIVIISMVAIFCPFGLFYEIDVLSYSALSAYSVKQMFPFRVCKITPKQPQIYFRGGQIMASMNETNEQRHNQYNQHNQQTTNEQQETTSNHMKQTSGGTNNRTQDSSKWGALETGCSGLHYIIGCFIIQYYPNPLHLPPAAPPSAEYPCPDYRPSRTSVAHDHEGDSRT